MNFIEIIEAIENELALGYMPGAIKYIDLHYDNAWSKSMERFDLALSKCIETSNYNSAEVEGEIYKDSILRLIHIYKCNKSAREAEKFLSELGE